MGDVGVCRCLTSAEGLVKNHGGEWKGNHQRRCLTSVKGGVLRVTRTIDNDKESARGLVKKGLSREMLEVRTQWGPRV